MQVQTGTLTKSFGYIACSIDSVVVVDAVVAVVIVAKSSKSIEKDQLKRTIQFTYQL